MKSRLRKGIASAVVGLLLFALAGCASPGVSVVSMSDYTGKAPNGSLGTVKYIADRPGFKGLELKINITGFGDVDGVDNSDAEAVSTALVKHAAIVNDSGYSVTQYYFTYSTKDFRSGSSCPVTLYYLIDPSKLGDNLRFTFDYTTPGGQRISVTAPVDVFK